MISREAAIEILNEHLKVKNLFRHCLAVEAAMEGLARYFKKKGEKVDIQKWRLVGLLHDGDWEETKDKPQLHTEEMTRWLKKKGETDKQVLRAISCHNYSHGGETKPTNLMEWALICCDDLTGLIVATALVMPDKKISSVRTESVLKKFSQKSFAANVKREQISLCEEKLGIELPRFVQIVLKSMQNIGKELGL